MSGGSFIVTQGQGRAGGGGGGGGGGGATDGVPYKDYILAEPSLRHYYVMDDTPALDGAGQVHDSKGTKHGTAKASATGWLVNDQDSFKATLAPDGRSKAPMLDNSQYGGYIDLTADFGDDFMLGRNPFTYEAWFMTNTYGSFALPRYFSKEAGFLSAHFMNTSFVAMVQRNGNQANAFSPGGHPIRQHAWHHLVGTYDGDTLVAYADGQAQGSIADASPLVANSYVASIGAGGGKGGNETMRGAMCHVAFYDVALDSGQVRNHWNAMWKSAVKIV